jgi:hypothetical protein
MRRQAFAIEQGPGSRPDDSVLQKTKETKKTNHLTDPKATTTTLSQSKKNDSLPTDRHYTDNRAFMQ